MARKPKPFPVTLESAWEAFWVAYPRRDGKVKAREVFATLVVGGVDPAFLARAAERQARAWTAKGIDPMYFPYARTWLGQRVFEDDALVDPPEGDHQGEDASGTPEPDYELWPAFQAIGMDRDKFDTWIGPLTVVRAAGGVVATLEAPTPFHADYVRGRLDPEVRRALGHCPEITVRRVPK
ncbi:DnaA N-terminal domain-containing protein [Rhodospirillum sp. A1_3_36]|uniref:DnaA N-terminal domain-containing protein n=1 Tax=Rhodospirillum sp. A1_3_36 TaxID=3391666 RepID=UPI0039A702CC